jgi:hypothetical protein
MILGLNVILGGAGVVVLSLAEGGRGHKGVIRAKVVILVVVMEAMVVVMGEEDINERQVGKFR